MNCNREVLTNNGKDAFSIAVLLALYEEIIGFLAVHGLHHRSVNLSSYRGYTSREVDMDLTIILARFRKCCHCDSNLAAL